MRCTAADRRLQFFFQLLAALIGRGIRESRKSGNAVELHAFHPHQTGDQCVLKRKCPLPFLLQIRINRLGCECHACDPRNIFRTGTHAVLLPTAQDLRFQFCLFGYVKQPDSLRPVEFVCADAQQVNAHLLGMDHAVTKALHRIHVEKDLRIFPLEQLSDVLNRLHGTDLVIRMHHRDQYGISGDHTVRCFHLDDTVTVYRPAGHFKALALQMFHRPFYRRMLQLCRHDMHTAALVGVCRSDNRQIITFRSAGGKIQFLRFDPQDLCQLFFGLPQILLRNHPKMMCTRRITVILRINLCHQFGNFIQTTCCGRIIQIDLFLFGFGLLFCCHVVISSPLNETSVPTGSPVLRSRYGGSSAPM